MTIEQARIILHAVRTGLGSHYTVAQITHALILTGDITP